jgi:hypothetical protein
MGWLYLNATFTGNAVCFKIALQRYSKCYCVASVTKTLNFKAYRLSIVQNVERWIVYTPLSVNVLVTFATQ